MTETATIELSNEEDTLESIAIAFGVPMVSEKFRAEVGKILENSEKYHGIFTLSDEPDSTDKLSVEKLQERCDRYEKALTEISNHYLTDESYDGDADYREIAINALAATEEDDE